jgi:hypothetical protein
MRGVELIDEGFVCPSRYLIRFITITSPHLEACTAILLLRVGDFGCASIVE